jgi:hypothetical protein
MRSLPVACLLLIAGPGRAERRRDGGALAFFANQLSGTVHLVIDVNGYFMEPAGAVVALRASAQSYRSAGTATPMLTTALFAMLIAKGKTFGGIKEFLEGL